VRQVLPCFFVLSDLPAVPLREIESTIHSAVSLMNQKGEAIKNMEFENPLSYRCGKRDENACVPIQLLTTVLFKSTANPNLSDKKKSGRKCNLASCRLPCFTSFQQCLATIHAFQPLR
jgi:hypothetical protein